MAAELNDWVAVDDGHPNDWADPDATLAGKVRTNVEDTARAHSAIIDKALAGAEAGFGDEPLGISPENQKKYPIFAQMWQPEAVALDAALRAPGAVVGAVQGGVEEAYRQSGAESVLPPEMSAQRLTRDVGVLGQGAMIEGGMMNPAHVETMRIQPPHVASPDVAEFVQRAQETAPPPPSATRTAMDEFLRRRDAGWTYDDASGQWMPPATEYWKEPLQLPPPSEAPPSAPAAAEPPNAPAPGAPAAPVAGARPLDEAFPPLEETGRAAPPAPPVEDWTVPPQDATIRPEDVPPPKPPANVGRATLDALLKDKRSAVEIKAEMDAARARDQAIIDQAQQHAQAGLAPAPAAGDVSRESTGQVPENVDINVNPPPGHREAPVKIEQSQDITIGAEHTATPTPAQAEAGNYRKRHVKWQGLDLAIETEAGQDRTGVGSGGEPWSVTLTSPYGYVKGTTGRDGDQVDAYLGPEPQSPTVYIVDQIDPQTGAFDEHKALIGYPDEASARAAYVAGFSDNQGEARLGSISGLPVAQFKDWLSKGQRRAPIAYSDPVSKARSIAREHGLNATDAEIEQAVLEQKDSGVDLTDAVFGAVERGALADHQAAIDTAKAEGLSDAWTTDPTATDATGTGPSPAGERPTEPQAAPAPEPPPPREQPGAVEPAASAEPVAPAAEVKQSDQFNEVVKAKSAAGPIIELGILTAARLTKLAKKIPSMSADERTAARAQIDADLSRMDSDGKKIAEHCVETGAKFSIR